MYSAQANILSIMVAIKDLDYYRLTMESDKRFNDLLSSKDKVNRFLDFSLMFYADKLCLIFDKVCEI